MIHSPLMQLDEIDINSFNFGFSRKPRKKSILIKADNLDFNFIPQSNKKNPEKKRLLFSLSTRKDTQSVMFEISLTFNFKFTTEISDEDKQKFIVSGLLPQIISFCRGYLYSVSSNLPARILIPPINVIESVKEKFQETQEEVDMIGKHEES